MRAPRRSRVAGLQSSAKTGRSPMARSAAMSRRRYGTACGRPESLSLAEPQPLGVHRELKDAYLRYYDTAFWLRDEQLRSERRALLERPGVVFTEPLLEPVLPYDSTETIEDVCQ